MVSICGAPSVPLMSRFSSTTFIHRSYASSGVDSSSSSESSSSFILLLIPAAFPGSSGGAVLLSGAVLVTSVCEAKPRCFLMLLRYLNPTRQHVRMKTARPRPTPISPSKPRPLLLELLPSPLLPPPLAVEKVGLAVGIGVGTGVGTCVGFGVGLRVGGWFRPLEGTGVGASDGRAVVGSGVGTPGGWVGMGEGPGVPVGICVGGLVGIAEGASVGG